MALGPLRPVAPAQDDLETFWGEVAGRAVDYVDWDCCQYLAAWIGRHRGVAAGFKGYRGEREALWKVHLAGGLVPLLTALASDAGLAPVTAPRRGDVGVVRVRGALGTTAVGGIFAGRRWGVLSTRGLAFVSGPPLASWEV